MSLAACLLPLRPCDELLAVDSLLWPFWAGEPVSPARLARSLESIESLAAWDYLVGNALRGELERALLDRIQALEPGVVPGWVVAELDQAWREGASPRPGSPVERLLLAVASAGSRLGAPLAERPALDLDRVDWEAVVRAASRAGLSLCLYHDLDARGLLGVVPERDRERLVHRYLGVTSRMSWVYQALGRVLGRLHEQGIEALVLKEGVLPDLVYHSVDRRVIGDLDLLVRPDQIDRADATLRELGLRPDIGYADERWYRQHHHHLAPLILEGRLKVELHRFPVSRRVSAAVDAEGLWSRARLESVAGSPALVPASEDFVQLLSLHVAADGFVGKALDVSELAAFTTWHGAELDWDLLVQRSLAQDTADMVRLALRLARDLFGGAFPETAEQALADGAHIGRHEEQLVAGIARRSLFERLHAASLVPGHLRKFAVCQLLADKPSPEKWGALIGRTLGLGVE